MSITSILHKSSLLRAVAKKLLRNLTLKQKFFDGVIAINAVDQAWGWTAARRYEDHDVELHTALLKLSHECEYFIDIGCNIGTMTLALLMKNKNIKAISVDPNRKAIALLKQSLALNNLQDRAETICAVVTTENKSIGFAEKGSVIGHVSETAELRDGVGFAELLNKYLCQSKVLLKVDVEAYETVLLEHLDKLMNLDSLTLVIELHPKGFNSMGDPVKCASLLNAHKAALRSLDGKQINQIDPDRVTQVVVNFT